MRLIVSVHASLFLFMNLDYKNMKKKKLRSSSCSAKQYPCEFRRKF
uniref:Uncharacterized protein n=1 Tax=Rhizophora mucronata TaxID=61149 RepID=A0A2P2MY36_RHIMU